MLQVNQRLVHNVLKFELFNAISIKNKQENILSFAASR